MLRWTGGSKARATFRKTTATASSGDGGDNIFPVSDRSSRTSSYVHHPQNPSRCEDVRLEETSEKIRRNKTDICFSLPKDCSGESQSFFADDRKHDLSCSSPEGRGGRHQRGVDCMALEWSLKAASAAATQEVLQQREMLSSSTRNYGVPETSPAYEDKVLHVKGCESTVCNESMFPSNGCWYSYTDSRNAAEIPEESYEAGFLFEEVCTLQAAGSCVESQCAPPFLISAVGDATVPMSDSSAWSPQTSLLWHPFGLAGERQPQRARRVEDGRRDFASQPGWSETDPHDFLNDRSYRRTPFASPSPLPDAYQTCAWPLNDPAVASAHKDFQATLLDDSEEEDGRSGKSAAHVMPMFAETIASVGPHDYCNRYGESTSQRHEDVFYGPPALYTPFTEVYPQPRAPVSALTPTSPLGCQSRERVTAYSSLMETITPYNGVLYDEHRMWLGMSATPQGLRDPPPYPASRAVVSRGRRVRGRGRGGGRGGERSRGYVFNLSGDVPSSRYNAFQRRCRQG